MSACYVRFWVEPSSVTDHDFSAAIISFNAGRVKWASSNVGVVRTVLGGTAYLECSTEVVNGAGGLALTGVCYTCGVRSQTKASAVPDQEKNNKFHNKLKIQ